MAVRSPAPSEPMDSGDNSKPSLHQRTAVPLAGRRCAYYVIDALQQPDGEVVYRVWCRSGEQPVATLLGVFATIDDAKASMPVDWRPATGTLEAWALGSSHARLRPTPAPADEMTESAPGA